MKRDLVLGLSFAVSVASVLLSVFARNFVKSNKKSTHRKADDTGASSSSTASAESNSYDVFLSFHGDDTRKTFTDHLYNGLVKAGICVFRDNNELPEGEKIGTNLCQAIKNSKISIPILSPNYTSSKWCLQELVEMTECIKSGHVVLPIFYHVEPTHVRDQKGSFGKTFSRLSSNYVKEDVAKWKQALQEVASVKGWEPKKTADGHEGELVEMVIRKVLRELKKTFQLVVPEQLVGIENAVEDILRLLNDNPSATQVVGIHGMGGIGKTTLAKVVYNKLSDQFQDHSFIADIRESSRSKGIAHLQEQLIFDILKENDLVSNTDEGIGIIASRFKRKKVLILLDDVDNNDQVKALVGKRDWFGMGSKIIITTRISSVLDQAEVKCKYALKEIADDESLILFSRHAFRKDSPPCEFEPLSCDVVSTIRGLPLALEVIGSNLCGRDEEYWQDALKKLKDVPHERVQKTLKISYDALNYEEKHIFLDIACFFIGADLRYASYMWDACKLYPKLGIETLSFMSLIKIGDDGKVQMHDQLRDLGRDIVRQEDYNMPMKRSRLWVHEEALEVLERNKMAKHLKVLDLTHCRCLKVTPNLSAFQNLEIFRLKDCRNLKQIDPSIGAAKSLIFLDLQECDELRELPQEMCKLEKLKELDISETAIVEIPPCIGSLRKLEVLYAAGCKSLVGLPDSIRHLVNLSTLDLSFCPKLCKLPESIGYLVKLERLSCGFNYPHYHITDDRKFHRLSKLISFDAGICKLLESIGDLKNLKFLHIAFSNKLSNLPNTISKLGNLEELDATGCKSLGGEIHIDGLSSLKILRFKGTGVFGFHGTFDKLSHLEKLELDDCQMLQSLPKLPTSLTVLEVTGQHHTFPQLSHLIHLKKLTVVDCPLLESVPELPSGLSELSVHNCRKLKELPSLSRLEFLSELYLDSC